MIDWVKRTTSSKMSRFKLLRLTAGLLLLSLVTGLECPDQQRCGDEQTCCQIHPGEFNCCPFPQGECCEDHLHCCPGGMLCEVKESKCTNATHSFLWTERLPSRLVKSIRMISSSAKNKLYDAACPDNSFCPSEFSCLKVSNTYGCCPVAQGIVCSDGKHCCPNDHECTADGASCVKKTEPVLAVLCADGISECPEESSCCETAEGGWECCPMTRAVCCEDHIHCCPQGTKCNLAAQRCDRPSGSVPWLKKEPSRPVSGQKVLETKGSVVPCDDVVACPDNSTCCKNGQGGWNCCPLVEAVCCEDFIHCCPHGTKCNLIAQTCDDLSGSMPWLKKEPSRPIAPLFQNTSENELEVKCDSHTFCPDHTTCCLMEKSQRWGCCPLDQAICCAGGENCCPKGYICHDQWCVKSSWTNFDAMPLTSVKDMGIPQTQTDIDCGGGFSCSDSETCCKMSESSWGCCPYSKAVCCSDMVHCCPTGYICDESGSCKSAMGFNWEMFFSRKKQDHTL